MVVVFNPQLWIHRQRSQTPFLFFHRQKLEVWRFGLRALYRHFDTNCEGAAIVTVYKNKRLACPACGSSDVRNSVAHRWIGCKFGGWKQEKANLTCQTCRKASVLSAELIIKIARHVSAHQDQFVTIYKK